MMQLEFGGRRYEIPAGELAVGSDPNVGVVLTGEGVRPRHAVFKGTSEGNAIVQRGAPDAETLVNGVRLGAEPAPLLHGDKIQIGGQDILVVDSRKSGSTQFMDASAVAAMAAAAHSSPKPAAPTPVTGGRLVCLTDGREYTIAATLVFGREAGSEVVIESTQVSRRHAEIAASAAGYVLTDLSTNGTYVNGQRVQGSRTLARADMIRIADYEFRFYADAVAPAAAPRTTTPVESAPPAPAPAPAPPASPSIPLSTPMSSGPIPTPLKPPAGAASRLNDTMHGQSFRPTPAPAPAVAEAPKPASGPMASLLVRSGPLKGTRLPIRVPVVNIGRAEYNDIVLADESVSTAHAKLQRREGVWTLVDLGSTNGTFVDGEQLQGEVPLAPGATVRFGQVSTMFEPTDDAMGVAKGSGTRMIEPVQVPAAPPPAAKPAPPPPAPTPAPAAAPVREPAPRPAPRRPPVVVTPPAKSSSARWLVPLVIAAGLAALIIFLLSR
jgi:pSer/pThr/pTyr-binding forkhead associated (FHA) protein